MDPATYERPPENLDPAARELIRGIYKLKGRLLLVLDAERTAEITVAGNSNAAANPSPTEK
jgi:chemotaxis signal transduction protein